MNDHVPRSDRFGLPFEGMLLGFPLPLALGALLSDWAYSRTFQVQWLNFADWLVAGSLAGAGLALVATIVRAVLGHHRAWPDLAAAAMLLLFVIVQFFNALVHARDAFASMPAGLVLSLIATIVALSAGWLGFARFIDGDRR